MAKPLDEFGGWLRFFEITSWIGVVVISGLCMFLLLALAGVERTGDFMSILISAVDSIVYVVLMIKLLKIIRIKDPETPSKVVGFLKLVVLFTVLFTVCDIISAYFFFDKKEFLELAGVNGKAITQAVFWFLVWRSYFTKSKRVEAYYV